MIILALDIGGSKLLSSLVEVSSEGALSPRLTGVAKRALRKDSRIEGVWNSLNDAIAETLSNSEFSLNDVERVGISIPGVADPRSGLWIYAPYSGISNFPIAERVSEKYARPVVADNDVNACAWGEKVFGACRNVENFLWITISNGIGGGLVLNNRIYPGKFFGAAEMGHLNVIEDGPLCGCGNRGCLEAAAAGPAIARNYKDLIESIKTDERLDKTLINQWYQYLRQLYGKETLDDVEVDAEIAKARELKAVDIAREARRGNPIAIEIFNRTGAVVGKAASWACNLLNPEKIIIGGGVAQSFDLFYPSLIESFNKRVFKQANQSISIEKTQLGYEAGLLGAAALATSNPYSLE